MRSSYILVILDGLADVHLEVVNALVCAGLKGAMDCTVGARGNSGGGVGRKAGSTDCVKTTVLEPNCELFQSRWSAFYDSRATTKFREKLLVRQNIVKQWSEAVDGRRINRGELQYIVVFGELPVCFDVAGDQA